MRQLAQAPGGPRGTQCGHTADLNLITAAAATALDAAAS